jgi:hypothetical protein
MLRSIGNQKFTRSLRSSQQQVMNVETSRWPITSFYPADKIIVCLLGHWFWMLPYDTWVSRTFNFTYQWKANAYPFLQWHSSVRPLLEKKDKEENHSLQVVLHGSVWSDRIHVCCSEHLGSLIRWLFALTFLAYPSRDQCFAGELTEESDPFRFLHVVFFEGINYQYHHYVHKPNPVWQIESIGVEQEPRIARIPEKGRIWCGCRGGKWAGFWRFFFNPQKYVDFRAAYSFFAKR